MIRLIFYFHLFITLLAWVAPFLFNWQILLAAYGTIVLQFVVFGRCLLNKQHALDERDNVTFYSHLLEGLGMRPDRLALKRFVHRMLYPLLAALAVWWQWGLGNAPLLF